MRRSILLAVLIAFPFFLFGTLRADVLHHGRSGRTSILNFTPFHGAPAEHSSIVFQTRKYRPRSTQPTSADEVFRFRCNVIGTVCDDAPLAAMVTELVRRTRTDFSATDRLLLFTTAERKLFAGDKTKLSVFTA